MLHKSSYALSLVVLALVALLALPAAVFASPPPSTPAVLATENFDDWSAATTSLTVLPSGMQVFPLDVAATDVHWYWGPDTTRKLGTTGSGMWIGNSPAQAFSYPYAPETFPVDGRQVSAGEASLELTQSPNYYDTKVGFQYLMGSLGPAEKIAPFGFRIAWDNESTASLHQDSAAYIAVPTSVWSPANYDLSNAADAHGNNLSRVKGKFSLQWRDNEQVAATFSGPTVDNLVVSGWKYGPVRSLSATISGVTSDTVLTWTKPAASTALASGDETRAISYRVWRSPAGANTWTELTADLARQLTPTYTDVNPGAGPWDYEVQVWDSGTGTGYGMLAPKVSTAPPVTRVARVDRIGGPNRFAVAVGMAAKEYPGWVGVKDVIIASGDDAAAADPLAAAGLAGAYRAPILLVSKTGVDSGTRSAIASMASKNHNLRIHIVGGPGSVPSAVQNTLHAIPFTYPTIERIGGADRYTVTANIANAMINKLGVGGINGVLIVCSENPAAFYDALASSPIAYSKHMPMLGVRAGAVPGPVSALLKGALKTKPVYIVSGYVKVSISGATRVTSSTDRYQAALDIANKAVNSLGLSAQNTAIAAKLPDALGGGAFAGFNNGVLLFTGSTGTIQTKPLAFITANKVTITQGWLFGGPASVPDAQLTSFYNTIK